VVESVVEVDGVLTWGVPKGYERRSVPIPAFLADELRRHLAGREPDDLVFTGLRGGGALRNRIFRRAGFDRAAVAVGLDGLVPHELRHTAASLAVSSGANVKAVQRILGARLGGHDAGHLCRSVRRRPRRRRRGFGPGRAGGPRDFCGLFADSAPFGGGSDAARTGPTSR
jgi:integrase